MNPTQPAPKAAQQNVALELMRGNTDVLDRIHPQLGWTLFVLSCLLLAFGLWLKWREKRTPPTAGGNYAGMC